jgi:hypothetical protein
MENALDRRLMVWTPPAINGLAMGQGCVSNIRKARGSMEVTTIGIDLANSVFAVSGADSRGRVVIRRQLRRPQVLGFMRGLPRRVVGMEARWSALLGAPAQRAGA